MITDGDNPGEPRWDKAIFIIVLALALLLLAGLAWGYVTSARV